MTLTAPVLAMFLIMILMIIVLQLRHSPGDPKAASQQAVGAHLTGVFAASIRQVTHIEATSRGHRGSNEAASNTQRDYNEVASKPAKNPGNRPFFLPP